MQDIRNYLSDLQTTLDELPIPLIEAVVMSLQQARLKLKKVFIMGNGGSASTASHFVCDLAKNTRLQGWPDFRVIGLTDNMAIFSAYANDDGYENVFAQQLASLVDRGDIVIGISTSGNSANVVRACELATERGAYTIGFTGFSGGMLAATVDLDLHVPSDCIEQVEDIHLMLEHLITKALRERLESVSAADWRTTASATQEGSSTLRDRSLDWRQPLRALRKELQTPSNQTRLLERSLILTVENVGARSGSIVVLDEKGDIVDGVVAYAGELHESDQGSLAQAVKGGLAGWVYRNGQAALIKDTNLDQRWFHGKWDRNNGAPRSAISVPLMAGDRIVGVLTLVNPTERVFTETDLALLCVISMSIPLDGADPLAIDPSSSTDGTALDVGVGTTEFETAAGTPK